MFSIGLKIDYMEGMFPAKFRFPGNLTLDHGSRFARCDQSLPRCCTVLCRIVYDWRYSSNFTNQIYGYTIIFFSAMI